MQNVTLVAGMVGAQLSHPVILLAAGINAIAGVLSMSMGTYVSSKAERDVKLATGAGSDGGHTPTRDAAVMAVAYAVGATVPLVPFVLGAGDLALVLAMALTGLTLFGLGALKAVLSHQRRTRSGFEMLVLASAAGVAGYLIGAGAEALFDLQR